MSNVSLFMFTYEDESRVTPLSPPTFWNQLRPCLTRTAPHRPRCERLFVSAGRLKKEIFKNTVSFWLRKVISQAYRLSGRPLPGPSPRARETHGIAPSLLFKKNFAVHQVLKVGTWRRHTTFTRQYLRDLSHKSLDTFHLGSVVAAQALVQPDLLPGHTYLLTLD